MTREEAKAVIIAAGGEPSDSAWLKYSIPERGKTYCAFPTRHYSEMEAAELKAEVEAYRARSQAMKPQANGAAQ
jgi:hypothetical protein